MGLPRIRTKAHPPRAARHPTRSGAHRNVLARLPAAFNGRWTRRQWAHVSLFATLGALVAAIVPGFSGRAMPAPAPTQARTTLALSLPSLSLARLHGQPGDSWQLVR